MAVLAQILVDFMFRLTFGIAVTMAVTPARQVTAGFYRVHLWVLMGLNTFAAVAIYLGKDRTESAAPASTSLFWLAVALAAISYVGAVIWIYERAVAGKASLWLITAMSVVAMCLAKPARASDVSLALDYAHLLTSGFLMGSIMTAMFLGHWYLNTPTMDLQPLRRLIILIGCAVVLRGLTSAIGFSLGLAETEASVSWWWFVVLRWASGLIVIAALAWLTWLTLKIPNTQSATGILYAAVILVFIGELTSQLLSHGAAFAL